METPVVLPSDEVAIPAQLEAGGAPVEHDDRTRVLKHGAVFDRYGDVVAAGKREQGLYHKDTRFLSHSRLSIDGKRPLLLSSTISQDNALIRVDLANPTKNREDHVERERLHVLRSKFLWN